MRLLARQLRGDVNINNVLRGMDMALGEDRQADGDVLSARVADAWAWLESHALLGPDPKNTRSEWQRVTEAGRELCQDQNAITRIWAEERLAGDLDPLLLSARSNFALGDYETASFAAMKAVEVEVRRVSGLPGEIIGVPLMRKAFSPKDGVLRDPGADGGEQQATMDLFAGAIGAFKNPASHRTVSFDDAIEAAEAVQLADLLLRIVHRAERRVAEEL
ncbi:MAG: TIGR02391 family protein [Gaiellales bacterium]